MFTVNATITHHYRDDYNYPTTSDEVERLEEDTLDGLYEAMAKFRARNSHRASGYEWWDVDFGTILEVIAEHDFDRLRLEATQSWRAHEESEAAKKRAQEQAEEEAKCKEALAKEERDRREYERLKTKFGSN
jgi:hypothetical protein